jgi:hypothetical protein
VIPVFGARYQQLVRDAQARGFKPTQLVLGAGEWTEEGRSSTESAEVSALSGMSFDQRAQHCLKLLLEATSATAGFL